MFLDFYAARQEIVVLVTKSHVLHLVVYLCRPKQYNYANYKKYRPTVLGLSRGLQGDQANHAIMQNIVGSA